ncbi:hypothetical protein ACW9H6_17080 [Pseudomonas sp. SDO528_S397]
MPFTTYSSTFSVNQNLFNGPDDHQRVPLRQALSHPAIAAGSTRHPVTVKAVSPRQMDALLVANQAIDDTWQVLNSGSGNQVAHLLSTDGDSFKRTMLSREGAKYDQVDLARNAARFQAGNCGEMNAVCALLCASSGIQQPVSLLVSPEPDHTVALIGDRRAPGQNVVADAWPEFGRALLREDCSLLGPDTHVVHVYQPSYAPQERTRLLYDAKVSQKQLDRDFAKLFPEYPSRGQALAQYIIDNKEDPTYVQQHSTKNLGILYEGVDSQNRRHVVDLNLSQEQLKRRLIQLGLDPKTGHPIPGNRRPHNTLMDDFKGVFGRGRVRHDSLSAGPAPVTVAWTPPVQTRAPEPRPPQAPPVATVRPRHQSTTAAQQTRTPWERNHEVATDSRGRRPTADVRAPREERHRDAHVDPRSRRVPEETRAPREERRREASADPRSRRPTVETRAPREERRREASADPRSRRPTADVRAPREERRREASADPRSRRATEETRAPREERRREPSAAPRSRRAVEETRAPREERRRDAHVDPRTQRHATTEPTTTAPSRRRRAETLTQPIRS